MAEPLVLDTYPVTIWNIYVTSSKSSLFSMQLVLSSRNAGVFVCSIAADWPTAVPWTLFQALSSPQPSALCPWPLVLASVHRDRLTGCSLSIFLSLSLSLTFPTLRVSRGLFTLFIPYHGPPRLPEPFRCDCALIHASRRFSASLRDVIAPHHYRQSSA